MWARVRAEVEVVENPRLDRKGGGFPTLKVTDTDIDPETGEKRQSDPDEPPGTPPRVVRDRIARIESTLKEALQYMETRGVDALFKEKDRVLCERLDIERCIEFHNVLKERFSKELKLLLG